MTLTGFSLPELSAFDPTVEVKEASTQMGLAAIPDRLADLLVPGLRARMKRVRFVTASAVGDAGMRDPRQREPRRRISTRRSAFEWLVLELLCAGSPAPKDSQCGARQLEGADGCCALPAAVGCHLSEGACRRVISPRSTGSGRPSNREVGAYSAKRVSIPPGRTMGSSLSRAWGTTRFSRPAPSCATCCQR